MKEVNSINYQLNALLECIEIYSDLGSTLTLTSADVKRLDDYIKTQNEKIKQLRLLTISLDKELTNVTKEVEEIEL